jgi:hypothetical protein
VWGRIGCLMLTPEARLVIVGRALREGRRLSKAEVGFLN